MKTVEKPTLQEKVNTHGELRNVRNLIMKYLNGKHKGKIKI